MGDDRDELLPSSFRLLGRRVHPEGFGHLRAPHPSPPPVPERSEPSDPARGWRSDIGAGPCHALPVPCDAIAATTEGDSRIRGSARPARLELAVRIALAVGIAYQVAQRFTYTGYGMSEYGRSLWYVTYRHGFVRRGLAGEALRTIVGDRPTIATVDLVQNIVAVVTFVAMSGLVVLLCHRRTLVAYASAAALVVSPFAFDSVGGQRRPDLLAFLVLVVIGLWAGTRSVAPTRLALVAGALPRSARWPVRPPRSSSDRGSCSWCWRRPAPAGDRRPPPGSWRCCARDRPCSCSPRSPCTARP